jgi:hypothetical protein
MGSAGVSLLHDYRHLSDEEKLFMVGVIYLDNKRLRRIVARLAPRVIPNGAKLPPLTFPELEDIAGVVAEWAHDDGHKELAEALKGVRARTL